MDAKKEEQERFDAYQAYAKSRERHEADFIEDLKDQLDVSKQIDKYYKGIVKKLGEQNSEVRIAKEMQKTIQMQIDRNDSKIAVLGKVITRNASQLADIGEKIISNDARIFELDQKINGLLQQRASIEVKLGASKEKSGNIQRDIVKKQERENWLNFENNNLGNKILANQATRRKIQDDINKGLINSKDGLRQILRLEKENKSFNGQILSNKKELTKTTKERGSLEKNLTTEKNKQNELRARDGALEKDILGTISERSTYLAKNAELQKKQFNIAGKTARAENKQNELIGKRATLGVLLGKQQSKELKAVAAINALKTQLVFVKMLQLAYERFINLDQAAEDFRKETGFSNTQMVKLRENVEAINVEFASMGVSVEVAYKSAKSLTDVFGRTSLVSKETLQNVSLLSVNLGVAQEHSAAVLATFQGLGGASEQAAMNIIKVGAGISEKAGIPFKLVMQDVASASEDTLASLGANPSKLMKSAIAARAMGMELNKLVSSQRRLLDFNNSINDEMEASALLGKNINFQLARQLAFEGRIEDSARATLETVKNAGDFNKMNVYQREALARASGMELKDLTKMMAVEAQRDAILNGKDEGAKIKLKNQEKELANLKKINKLDSDDLIRQNQKALMQEKMQGLMTKIKNIIDSITVAFADILEPIITPLIGILIPAFKLMGMLARTFAFILKGLIFPIKLLVDFIGSIVDGVGKIVEMVDNATSSFSRLSGVITTLFKGLLGLAGGVLLIALVGKAGWVGLWSKITTIFSTIKSGFLSLGDGNTWKTLWGGMQSGFKTSMDFIKNAWNKENPIGGMAYSVKSAFGKLKDMVGFGKKTPEVYGPPAPPISPDVSKTAVEAAKGATDVAKTSDTIKSTAGEGIKIFFENLAAGLKAMAGMEVLKGALNLIPASVGLVVMIPGVAGAKLLSMIDGDALSESLAGMAKGFKKMAGVDVLLGALNLIPASIGLVLMIPGVAGAKLLSMIDGDAVKEALGGIASGLKKMASVDVLLGAGALMLTSLALVAMIPGLIGMVGIASLGVPFSTGLIAMGVGLSALGGNPKVWLGIAAVAALSLAFVGFAFGIKLIAEGLSIVVNSFSVFGDLDWSTITKGFVAMLGLGFVAAALGLALPSIIMGAISLGVLSVAMLAFGAAMEIASLGFDAFDTVVEKLQMFGEVDWSGVAMGVATVVGAAASFAMLGFFAMPILAGAAAIAVMSLGIVAFAKSMEIAAPGFEILSNTLDKIGQIGGDGLLKTAFGITALAGALAAFGAGSAVAGIGNFIGGFLGGDPIDKLKELSSMGSQLQLTADSIQKISNSISNFGAVDAFSLSVDKLTLSLSKLNSQMESMSVIKMAALAVISAAAPTTAPTAGAASTDVSGIGGKIDELISLMRNGGIAINLNGKKVSDGLTPYAKA